MKLEDMYDEEDYSQIAFNDHFDFESVIVAKDCGGYKYDTMYFSIMKHLDTGKFYRFEWCAAYEESLHSMYAYEVKPVTKVVIDWEEV